MDEIRAKQCHDEGRSGISVDCEDDDNDDTLLLQTSHDHYRSHHSRPKVWKTTCWVLVALLLLQSLVFAQLSKRFKGCVPKETPNGLSYEYSTRSVGHMLNRFWSENDTTADDEAWTAIEAGHGIVAVTREWAAARGLPETSVHPLNGSMRVYSIEAYHSIHCIKTLRRHYLNLARGEIPDRPIEHDMHCFDSIRQSIMCSANDQLLYTRGHNDAGVGQVRQCRDWDALRAWATENTACYHDFEPAEGETRWGKCDGGVDGLPVGGLLN